MSDSLSETAGAGPDLKRARRQKPPPRDPGLDRLPPHSPESEQGVLGCMMLAPTESVPVCTAKLNGDSFYDFRHQTIYETMVEMHERQEPIDSVTLLEALKKKKMLEQVGGVSYFAMLPDTVPSSANLSYYVDIVHEKSLLRKTIHTCTEVIRRIYDFEGPVNDMLDQFENDIMHIRRRVNGDEADVRVMLQAALNRIEQWHQNKDKIIGLPTGFTDVDRMTQGLHKGEMTVIAAFPSHGKTSLMLNIIDHIAIELQKHVGIFSLEMTAEQLVQRLLLARARVNCRDVQNGFLGDRDFPKLTGAAGIIHSARTRFHIHDESDMSIAELRSKARKMVQEYDIAALGIDYLQLLTAEGRRIETRQQEVAAVSAGIKRLGKELGIPVIAASQLSDEGKLKESRAIGQDADGVWYLKKDKDEQSEDPDVVPMLLDIKKQRNGPAPCRIPLTFIKKWTRFENAARVQDEENLDSSAQQ